MVKACYTCISQGARIVESNKLDQERSGAHRATRRSVVATSVGSGLHGGSTSAPFSPKIIEIKAAACRGDHPAALPELQRIIKNVVFYRETIEALAHRVKRGGFDDIVFVGAVQRGRHPAGRMNHIRRALKDSIAERISGDNRLVLLFGPRQTGKPTLAREVMEQLAPGDHLLSGEDPRTAGQTSSCDLRRLRGIVAGPAKD